ncbi:MAG: hypothetical protein HYU64_07260 [Armatimonadetes bacterium]|nr:hypothetical protein [Armatimonadota bacterium]
MKRKQIYLSEDMEQELRAAALFRGASEAAIVREALEQYLQARRPKVPLEEDPLWKLVGIIEDGPPDASEAIDYYLYGPGREKP